MAQGNAFLNKMGGVSGGGVSDYLDLGDKTAANLELSTQELGGRNYLILESNLAPASSGNTNVEEVGRFQITGQAWVSLWHVVNPLTGVNIAFTSNTNLHGAAFKA